MYIKRNNQRNGFGLLEVLFSTSIFIVVVGSLVALSRISLRNSVLAAHRTQAVNLAQDGLETVRQMRDTAWLSRTSRTQNANTAADWLTYPNCQGQFATVVVNQEYEICYDATLQQFGLRTASTAFDPNRTDEHAYIVLKTSSGEPDPGSPLYWRRTVRFEAVPSGNEICDNQQNVARTGLQLLAPKEGLNDETKICPLENVEPHHAIKVKASVAWTDFDKEWTAELETMLTNWRSK